MGKNKRKPTKGGGGEISSMKTLKYSSFLKFLKRKLRKNLFLLYNKSVEYSTDRRKSLDLTKVACKKIRVHGKIDQTVCVCV